MQIELIVHSLPSYNSFLCRDAGGVYALEASDRLGRTRSKEQYAFMYRYPWPH